ncbi:MAG: transcriptional regulator, GntR family [Marmoricola sp.]|nr:transcriptional regulator, GntR family [Marmoricola sp.]
MANSNDGTAQGDLDRERFREVVGHFMTGVTVITTAFDGRDFGMTASAVASLSLDPPMMLVCLNKRSQTQEAVRGRGRFAVNVLAEGQHEVAKQFANPASDKFSGVAVTRGLGDLPLLTEALAVLECQVMTDLVDETHHVFFARVLRATANTGNPLAYYRGTFGHVELDLNDHALALVRRYVVTRQCAVDQVLDFSSLSHALELPHQIVYQALITLVAEGLVTRHSEREFTVTAVDQRTYEQAFRARTAIELGAAELAVGRVSSVRLRELRDRAWATEALVAGGKLVDVDAYIAADAAFHEYLVGLADSDALVAAYRRLSFPDLMASLLRGYAPADAVLSREHLALADAFEAGSIDEVRRAIRIHNEHAHAIGEAAVLAGGGRI